MKKKMNEYAQNRPLAKGLALALMFVGLALLIIGNKVEPINTVQVIGEANSWLQIQVNEPTMVRTFGMLTVFWGYITFSMNSGREASDLAK